MIQLHFDVNLIKKQIDIFPIIKNIKKKIKKILHIIKYVCKYEIIMLNFNNFRNTVKNKILELKNDEYLSDQ